MLSIIAWENIYVDITFKGNAMDFPGWCKKRFELIVHMQVLQ